MNSWFFRFSMGWGIFLFLSFGFVSEAFAWGPITHLHLGFLTLKNLQELSSSLQNLLSQEMLPFLYGCISADIILAKKLGRKVTHGHRWVNGLQLISKAQNPRQEAFSWGYVSHLAADTISHNCFIPSKMVESYDSGLLKHVYWEIRLDQKLSTSRLLKFLEEFTQANFSDCDDHLEKLIPVRLMDFAFNKQVFNHLLLIQGYQRWRKLWDQIAESSPWPLKNQEVQQFSHRSLTAILDVLKNPHHSRYIQLDPTGTGRLKSAQKIRNGFLKELRKGTPPEACSVRRMVQRFAREPFEPIPLLVYKKESQMISFG